MYGVLFKF